MEKSTNYNFNLPNSANDEIADINDISDNFRIIDEIMKETEQTFSGTSGNPQSGKAVAGALSGYVVAEVGKGLSSNDFTNEDKEKLYSALQNENIDQTYNPTSENAQSGKAVAEAVSAEQNRADNTFSNALKGSKSGSAILINDVSPVTHEMSVKVKSKNLIPYPYINTTKTQNGITFTDNGDGSITISGTAENGAYFLLCTVDFGYKPISAITADSATNGIYTASKRLYYNNASKVTSINIPSGATVDETIYPQLELGTTATDYTPYVPDLTAVKVSRCGKNLFDKSIPYSNYLIYQGGYRYLSIYIGKGSIVTVSLSQKYNPGLEGYFYCQASNGSSDSSKEWVYHNSIAALCQKSVTLVSQDGFVSLFMTKPAYNSFKDEIMVEIGSTATDYERYIAPTEYTPTADGTVNGVTILYPNTTLTTDTEGVIIDCEYNRDINKAFAELQQAIISLGGTI